jgi:hypothetical protein
MAQTRNNAKFDFLGHEGPVQINLRKVSYRPPMSAAALSRSTLLMSTPAAAASAAMGKCSA